MERPRVSSFLRLKSEAWLHGFHFRYFDTDTELGNRRFQAPWPFRMFTSTHLRLSMGKLGFFKEKLSFLEEKLRFLMEKLGFLKEELGCLREAKIGSGRL